MRLRLVSAFPLSVLAPVFLVLLALSFIRRGIDDFYPQLILNSLGCVDCRDEDSIPDHMVVSGLTASNFRSASQLATRVGLEHDLCDNPPNQVVLENCQQGTDEWRITKYLGDIEGYASSMSINKGESIDLFVNSNGTDYDIHVFRSGFYQGVGGRKLLSIRKLSGISQPQCRSDLRTGLTSCSNWSRSHRLVVRDDWVTGIYLIKLVRRDTGGQNYIIFVVRDDSQDSDILYQQSVSTYQAYNNFGGKSLYSQISTTCNTISGAPRAVEVSFDRPYWLSHHDDYQIYNPNSYLWSEFPMVYWLESQGYDVSYSTSIDTHRSGSPTNHNELLDHRVFLSVGHDEYWTQQMRNAVTEARDAGIHLGFFSANTMFKRIRLIPDPWTGEPDRVIVSYKTYEGGPVDPSGESTSTWRDPEGMNFPENELVGIQYIGDNDYHYFPLRVTAEQAEDKIYRHTPLIHLSPGSYAEIGRRLIGWEWDAVVDNGYTSPKLTILAASPVIGPILDDAGSTYHIGTASAHTIRYISPSGSIVFASGTNQWSWGLAIVEPNRLIQQITYNLFADMGVFPANPASHLVLDGPYDLVLSTGDEFREFASSTERKNGPKISELQVSVSGNSAQINWITDVPSNGQVWVKIAPGDIDYRQDDTSYWIAPVAASAGHDSFSTTHELTVYLEFNTPYFFQVASTDESRETTVSSDQSLHTNSGSILDQARVMARPLWRSIPCLIRENIFLALYPVALIIVIAPVMIWRMRKVGAPAKEAHEVPRDPPEPIL